MIKIRKSNERGQADHGWLKSYHTFSFAGYYDPNQMGFRKLRVINQDYIAAGGGFPTHSHRDMEIVTYMVDGELAHRDTMGNQEIIRRGEIQYMCAGTGIAHSEFNANTDKTAHLLQIWIEPQEYRQKPKYGQKSFMQQLAKGELVRVISPDGRDESVTINQDTNLWVGWLKSQKLKLPLKKDRHGWLQVISGEVKIHHEILLAGDAVAISGESDTEIETSDKTELLFFDLA
jgi:redox-sensitive bicupin YhaK (pirin superfamily)